MQNVAIMAFRKRLGKRGYTDISIRKKIEKKDTGLYVIIAVEPLAGNKVTAEYTIAQMARAFRF